MGNKNTKSPSKLDEREIQLLISNTNFTREQILQWHSAFLLEYKDGHISKKEFVELFKQLYNQGNPEKFAKFAFLVFDKDHNGKISFNEFLLSTSLFAKEDSPKADVERRIELAFDIFDINNDQKVDKKEMLLLYEAIYELNGLDKKSAKTKVEDIFKRFDADKSNSLCKKEFVSVMVSENIFNYF